MLYPFALATPRPANDLGQGKDMIPPLVQPRSPAAKPQLF